MPFSEMPPMLRGSEREQIASLRDYLVRLARSLDTAANAEAANAAAVTVLPDGRRVYNPSAKKEDSAAIDAVRKNALELRDLIIKSARDLEGKIDQGDNYVMAYADAKVEEYNSLYVARSEFGTFTETVTASMEATAKGVVESYDYGSAIESVQQGLGLVQNYYTEINGEIRRGIVQVPGSNPPTYEIGIAISQSLQFAGECGVNDPNNPGDGYTYYYLNEGQTFGLYTAKGWQFWINGAKVGWFDSTDSMLHVANVVVESALQIGTSWKITTSGGKLEFVYIGS